MQIYPAIDIKRGKTAYLLNGTAGDPVQIADGFRSSGASWLHVVDLDQAFETGGDNTSHIESIARIPGVSVQLGGRLRTVDQVRRGLQAGASRVVAATSALLDAVLLDALVREAGAGRIAVSIDVRQGQPVLRGTNAPLRESAADLAVRARTAGVETIVYRDLDRDGQLAGFDVAGPAALPSPGSVIVAGGGSSLADIQAARRAGVAGAIIGRALYDGRFTLGEAIACSR